MIPEMVKPEGMSPGGRQKNKKMVDPGMVKIKKWLTRYGLKMLNATFKDYA
jgi:hypothetical protein